MAEVRIVNRSGHALPAYQTPQSAGADLQAAIESEILLRPLERKLIPTGLYVQLPVGYEAQIRPRSGRALREGLTLLNAPGTVDADYRGEIKVLVVNLSDTPLTIRPGDRIAQFVLARCEQAEWLPTDSLETSSRASGGFGHTGD